MDPNLTRHGQILIADKGYRSAVFEAELADAGITLIRPAHKTKTPASPTILRPFRQIIESVNQTSKPNSISNATAHENPTESQPAFCNDSSPSPLRSGTTNHQPTRPSPLPHRLRPLMGVDRSVVAGWLLSRRLVSTVGHWIMDS